MEKAWERHGGMERGAKKKKTLDSCELTTDLLVARFKLSRCVRS